ncbi:MAG: right-handed parallel beta-helix repeat-containing protein [Sphingomonadales bacterium]|nr:right-handed parallel beta-helix repeat-containing protein [Sphingomonadales bacterium]
MKPIPFFVAASLLALASPALADTIRVEPGADAQSRLQSALIDAKPGDIVEIGAGRFDLTDGLSLDVDRVTVRGAGPSATILSFKGQKGAGEGLLVTADDVVLRGFAVEDSRGDGIKSKGANRIVYHDLRVEWTGGPKATNGAYGVYPVESSDILIDKVTVKGASDAGIYVGQSKNIIVRNSLAMFNVAGIEIENCYGADVYQNVATHNAGGILVFDLPNLPQKGGHSVRIFSNRSERNDTPNFAPKGNIVAGVPNGTGVIIMANRDVHVFNNILGENGSTNIFIVGYRNSFTDTGYNPLPANVVIGGNMHGRAGYAPGPQFEGGAEMLAAMGSVPPIVWDGTGSNIRVTDKAPTLSLGLTDPKARATSANPAVVDLSQGAEPAMLAPIVLPQSMEAAIR